MTQKLFRNPASLREIPDYWWNLLMDFNLWKVRMDQMPGSEKSDTPYRFANAFRYHAKKNGMRSSVRTKWTVRNGCLVYVQALPPDVSSPDHRWRLSEAREAPEPPQIPVSTGREPEELGKRADNTSIIERLETARQAAQLEPASAWALQEHPVIGWIMARCTCEAQNFRVHEMECGAYNSLPLLEFQLMQLKVAPETWEFHRSRSLRLRIEPAS